MRGATLRATRTACGFTKDEYARRLKVNPRTLSRWETEEYKVPKRVADQVSYDKEEMQDTLDYIQENYPDLDDLPLLGVHAEVPNGTDRQIWNAAVGYCCMAGGGQAKWDR